MGAREDRVLRSRYGVGLQSRLGRSAVSADGAANPATRGECRLGKKSRHLRLSESVSGSDSFKDWAVWVRNILRSRPLQLWIPHRSCKLAPSTILLYLRALNAKRLGDLPTSLCCAWMSYQEGRDVTPRSSTSQKQGLVKKCPNRTSEAKVCKTTIRPDAPYPPANVFGKGISQPFAVESERLRLHPTLVHLSRFHG